MAYFLPVLLLSCLAPPLALFVWIFSTDLLRDSSVYEFAYRWAIPVFTGCLTAALLWGAGVLLGKKIQLPESATRRYLPLTLPATVSVLASPLALLLNEREVFVSYMAVAFSVAMLCGSVLWAAAFLFGSRKRPRAGERKKAVLRLGLAFACCLAVTGWVWFERISNTLYDEAAEPTVGHGVDLWRYRPFENSEYNLLALPASPPSLRIDHNYPVLDGAIALLPVYGAVAQAVYRGLDEETVDNYVHCTNTPTAYKRLADGLVDIFFGLEPSRQQLAYIESKGLTPSFNPLAKEAFVFLVHRDNPVQGLTLDQIRAIYAKEITNWKDVGGEDKKILAFQRPEGSGSQTTMLAEVMQGRRMSAPLREENSEGMGDLINSIAEYRNRSDAIGYSFRWYATVQYANPDIRLLAVDGVSPTEENIRNGSYPLTVPFMAVTVRPLSPEAERLLKWMTGPEGRDLIRRTGYTTF